MPFIEFNSEATKREELPGQITSEGNAMDCDFAFIGEAPGRQELRSGKPLQGDTGSVFDHCLHNAGIIRGQQYITTLIKENPGSMTKYFNPKTFSLTELGKYWRDVLADELANCNAKILIPMGAAATAALTDGPAKISEKRGYMTYASDDFGNKPVLPTLGPASCLYGGSYINKYYISHDFQKISRLIDTEDGNVKDFDSTRSIFPTTIHEIELVMQEMRSAGICAVDIEVSNFEISCLSFAASSDTSYSILLQDQGMWTASEELQIWNLIASVLEDESITKIGQNFIFDMHFIMSHQHIFVRGPVIDTMIGHSIAYPDFLKGLGFLGSCYTHRPYWKDMVKFKGGNLKKDN